MWQCVGVFAGGAPGAPPAGEVDAQDLGVLCPRAGAVQDGGVVVGVPALVPSGALALDKVVTDGRAGAAARANLW